MEPMQNTPTPATPPTPPNPVGQGMPTPPQKSSSATTIIIVIVAVIVVLGLMGAAYYYFAYLTASSVLNRVADSINQGTNGNVNVDTTKDSVSITTDDGNTSITGGATTSLPSDFPSDAPKYPGASVRSKTTSSFGNIDSTSVNFLSSDSTEKISAFYEAQVPANGWTVVSTVAANNTYYLTATKGKRTLSVTVAKDNSNNSLINIIYGTGLGF